MCVTIQSELFQLINGPCHCLRVKDQPLPNILAALGRSFSQLSCLSRSLHINFYNVCLTVCKLCKFIHAHTPDLPLSPTHIVSLHYLMPPKSLNLRNRLGLREWKWDKSSILSIHWTIIDGVTQLLSKACHPCHHFPINQHDIKLKY